MAYSRIRFEIQNSATMTLVQIERSILGRGVRITVTCKFVAVPTKETNP